MIQKPLTIKDVVAITGFSPDYVYDFAQSLGGHKLGGRWIFDPGVLEERLKYGVPNSRTPVPSSGKVDGRTTQRLSPSQSKATVVIDSGDPSESADPYGLRAALDGERRKRTRKKATRNSRRK